MPKKLPPKNKTWVQLTKDFVKEWPEVLEGLHFQNLPVKYLKYVNIILKNNLTIHYDISRDLKSKKQETIARFLKKVIEENYIENILLYEDPDVILCSQRMIIRGSPTQNPLYNCAVDDYRKNYTLLDTSMYFENPNFNFYKDPYKELNVYIKDK